jgi:hypothetical protein
MTFEFTIPDWLSSTYRLSFPVKRGNQKRYVDFVVAERTPKANILVVLDYTTNVAYNMYPTHM